MWEWQGLMDSNHRMTESESVALPLGEAPIMAGVDGVKPPFADLESAVLLTELNSLRRPGEELRPGLRRMGLQSSQWTSRRWRPASVHCKEACRNS